MKNLLLAALVILSSTAASAEHCSMESKVKYDEYGLVFFPMSAGWAMGTRSMEYFSNSEDCFAEGLKWKGYIEADAAASPLISSVLVTYGSGKDQVTKEFEVNIIH